MNTFAPDAFVFEYTVGSFTEPVTVMLPVTSSVAFGTALPTPTLLPVTTRALVLNLPITTLSSLNTSSIGSPDTSLTAIKLPDILSTILNKLPDFPRNATEPSFNTSRFTLADPTLLLKNIFGLLLPDLTRVMSLVNNEPETSSLPRGVVVAIPTLPPLKYESVFARIKNPISAEVPAGLYPAILAPLLSSRINVNCTAIIMWVQ